MPRLWAAADSETEMWYPYINRMSEHDSGDIKRNRILVIALPIAPVRYRLTTSGVSNFSHDAVGRRAASLAR